MITLYKDTDRVINDCTFESSPFLSKPMTFQSQVNYAIKLEMEHIHFGTAVGIRICAGLVTWKPRVEPHLTKPQPVSICPFLLLSSPLLQMVLCLDLNAIIVWFSLLMHFEPFSDTVQ